MGSMQCNVEFGYQVSICSETKENHGKPWSRWPVAGPSGCKLTSSQQSSIKPRALALVPFCAVALLFKRLQVLVYTSFVCIWFGWETYRAQHLGKTVRTYIYYHVYELHRFEFVIWECLSIGSFEGERVRRRYTFFYITYINSVRTSQETQYISVV
jgi:hypothetical protein